MNRWTGTGHLTKDPKFLETDGGTAICALRIAVKRAGKQGNDGYFDVKCFEGQAHACADYLKAGREVAIDGRLLFEEFQTQDGSYASRVYIVAERVEFLASAARACAPTWPTGRQAGRAGRRRGWRRDRLLAGGRAIEIRRLREPGAIGREMRHGRSARRRSPYPGARPGETWPPDTLLPISSVRG